MRNFCCGGQEDNPLIPGIFLQEFKRTNPLLVEGKRFFCLSGVGRIMCLPSIEIF